MQANLIIEADKLGNPEECRIIFDRLNTGVNPVVCAILAQKIDETKEILKELFGIRLSLKMWED